VGEGDERSTKELYSALSKGVSKLQKKKENEHGTACALCVKASSLEEYPPQNKFPSDGTRYNHCANSHMYMYIDTNAYTYLYPHTAHTYMLYVSRNCIRWVQVARLRGSGTHAIHHVS